MRMFDELYQTLKLQLTSLLYVTLQKRNPRVLSVVGPDADKTSQRPLETNFSLSTISKLRFVHFGLLETFLVGIKQQQLQQQQPMRIKSWHFQAQLKSVFVVTGILTCMAGRNPENLRRQQCCHQATLLRSLMCRFQTTCPTTSHQVGQTLPTRKRG
jgi:hypothetical protein